MTKTEACPEGPGDAFRLFAAVNPAIWLPVHSDFEQILSRGDPTGRASPLETRQPEEYRAKRRFCLSEVLTPEYLPQTRSNPCRVSLSQGGTLRPVSENFTVS